MAVIDANPHPRVLFVGWHPDEPAFLEMAELVPTGRVWDGIAASVRWPDWDAVVARGPFIYSAKSTHPVAVLALGVTTLPAIDFPGARQPVSYGERSQVSPEFEINDGLGEPLRGLVREELAPWLRRQPKRPLMTRLSYRAAMRSEPTNAPGHASAWFARDPDGALIAGSYVCHSGGSVWSLPFEPEHPARWLAAALQQWHEERPDAFPSQDPWQRRAHWMSRAEREASAEIDAAERELREEVARRTSQIESLRHRLGALSATADRTSRRLLTATGDDLVDAVAESLTDLGMSMARRGPLSTATMPVGETAIVQVEGCTAGASPRDLLRTAKAAAAYERETGRAPERAWYVVNHFLAVDPDQRPEVLTGADDSVAEFASDGGAVIDTRELFALVRAVEDGLVSTDDALAALWSSGPRFRYGYTL